MAKFDKFLSKMKNDLYEGKGNTDNPKCPNCGSKMSFHGGDRPIGEGFWDCSCNFTFTENDLDKYRVK